MADSRRAVRRRLAALAALVSLGIPAIAAGALRSFEAEAGRYLSGHRVEGIGDVAALGSALAAPSGEARPRSNRATRRGRSAAGAR